MTFRAIVIEDGTAGLRELPERFLTESGGARPVAIDVAYTDLNYKDAMALTGRPGIVRVSPLIPGIDVVGRVRESMDARWRPGDEVVLTGEHLGERRHGGMSERARVVGDSLVRVPAGLTMRDAAAIGTAGFTAMQSVLALQDAGVAPSDGSIAVSGATGGVGSIAVAVLAKLGYEVTAITGRVDAAGEYLRRLGASALVDRAEFAQAGPPLQQRRWAGAIDCVGSQTLVNLLAQTNDNGTVTACGLAQGTDLPGTVMPFILRGVTLRGINSVTASAAERERVWARLAQDVPLELLREMTGEIALDDAVNTAHALFEGRVRGRTVIRCAIV